MADHSRLLNFRAGPVERLPEGFDIASIERANAGLKVICGSGDYVHFGVTNVEKYKAYDVFCCLGDDGVSKETSPDVYTSVEENLEYLNEHNLNKLLCLIDVFDEAQTANFSALFRDKCIQVNHQDIHSPIFNPTTCFQILKPGGIVVLKPTDRIRPDVTFWSGKEGTNLFRCERSMFLEPATNRQFENVRICTRRDYSPNLFGGRQRKANRKHSQKRKRTLRKIRTQSRRSL